MISILKHRASSQNQSEIEVAKLDQKLHKMRRESSTLNDKGVLPSISSNPPKKVTFYFGYVRNVSYIRFRITINFIELYTLN